MPIESVFTGGVVNANSIAARIQLPSVEGQVIAIESISAVRTGGQLLTDGDQGLVGISHRTDILTADLDDDEDDILDLANPNDIWWIGGLSDTDFLRDRLGGHPQLVAGPQTVIFFNGTGATQALRMDVGFHVLPASLDLTRWALLKSLTSYEGGA